MKRLVLNGFVLFSLLEIYIYLVIIDDISYYNIYKMKMKLNDKI